MPIHIIYVNPLCYYIDKPISPRDAGYYQHSYIYSLECQLPPISFMIPNKLYTGHHSLMLWKMNVSQKYCYVM